MQPGLLGSSAKNDGDIMRMIQDIERDIRELRAANPFAPMGMTPIAGGINITGTVNAGGAAGGAFKALRTDGTLAVSIDTAGIHALNPSGVEVTTVSAANGQTVITGQSANLTLSAAAVRDAGLLAPALLFKWTADGTQTSPAEMSANADSLRLFSPTTTAHGAAFTQLELYADGTVYLGNPETDTPSLSSTTTDMHVYASATGTVRLDSKTVVTGTFSATGTKAFIMPHPLDPTNKTLMHASTESPHNGVEYWGEATLDGTGAAIVELPSYFEALTSPDRRAVILTQQGCATVPMGYDPITAGKFTAYGTPGATFSWLVKAVRQQLDGTVDTLAFAPEINEPLGS